MKRFRFRLEAVLGLRSVAERSARERLGAAQHALAKAHAAREAASARLAELGASLAAARSGTFRPGEQSSALATLRLAERAVHEAARLAAEALAAREAARAAWLAARLRLQVLEQLEQKARLAHRDAAEKAEQALLDELASLAAARSASPFA